MDANFRGVLSADFADWRLRRSSQKSGDSSHQEQPFCPQIAQIIGQILAAAP